MNFRNSAREDIELNLTPLIDVVFLLLIFFMVSTTFDRQSEIAIALPESSSEPVAEKKDELVITIDAKGRYFVNQEEVVSSRIDILRSAIFTAAKGAEQPQVIIHADRQTPHQAVIGAMDALRQLGFNHLTFATLKAQ
ncbi:MAG: biopolymer transporter ExbD [Gammaproteobacteria bacterium]|nr:biopolymer transporter ExbD [Gammaproteobacteria bacterium]